jgi:hypothetical protein
MAWIEFFVEIRSMIKVRQKRHFRGEGVRIVASFADLCAIAIIATCRLSLASYRSTPFGK